jgi:hypothetical protein
MTRNRLWWGPLTALLALACVGGLTGCACNLARKAIRVAPILWRMFHGPNARNVDS